MIKINKYISDNEVIIYKSIKQKKFLLTFIIPPALLMIILVVIAPSFNNLFMGRIDFNSAFSYKASMIVLMIMPVLFIKIVDYLLNNIVITDKHIIIRKGIIGKSYIIDFDNISAYQHQVVTYKKVTSNFIHIHLKSGNQLSSGDLNIKKNNLTSLIKILNSKIDKVLISKYECKEFKQVNYPNCNFEVKRNKVLPIICASPFVIGLIMLVLYFGGINKMGEQINIEVNGTVKSKLIDTSSRRNHDYELTVSNTGDNKEYMIPVTYNIYTYFEKNDKITIKVKKGILGIVYDELFYKD